MSRDAEVQRIMLHLSVILSTAYELDKGTTPTPKGPMYLGFMHQGHNIDYFNKLMEIGDMMNYWKSTSETICLTELGIEKAKKLKEIETAHNS